MRNSALAVAFGAGLIGCSSAPERYSMDAEYLRKRTLTIAVLDVCVDGVGVDPAALQLELAQELRQLGWSQTKTEAVRRIQSPWTETEGAAAAKAKGVDSALLCVVRIAPEEPHHDPRADESVYVTPSDPTGARREYYRKEEASGATDRGPLVVVEVALVDGATGVSSYNATYRTRLKDADEAALAHTVLSPLKTIK